MTRIFVSYRRDDVRDMAARIRDHLVPTFGDVNVFMDVNKLIGGQRFDKELEKALSQTDVFLAVIGLRWMELFKARLTSGEHDYVREEIAGALQRGIVVIPVLIDRAPLPRPDALPEDIRDLALHQKHVVTHEQFGRDVTGLVEAIRVGSKSIPMQTASSAMPAFRWGWAGAAAVLALALAATYYWPRSPSISPPQVTASERARADHDKKQDADLTAQVKKAHEAKARAEADAKKEADLAEHVKRELAVRQKAEPDRRAREVEEVTRKAEAVTKAEEARRSEEARKAEEALARANRIRKHWQAGQLAGLVVQLDYGRDPVDVEAGRALARLLRELGAKVVLPGTPADIIARQQVAVRRSETIGKRKADVTITIECLVSLTKAPCVEALLLLRGAGEGPNFEIATDRALHDAIHALERQLRDGMSASRP